MLKVITVVGTRPEIIRLSRTIPLLDKHCHHVLVHTGQNYDYELNQIFFDELNIRKPDVFLDAARESAAETIGQVIAKFDQVLASEKPDAVLILGDTNSALSAIAAKRRKVPIFHMEAGNRSFDQRVPEEINRRIVDHISDINLTYSSIARDYLLREGFSPDQVIKTGSPMFEVLHYYLPLIESSSIISRLGLESEKYFLVSTHREENIDSNDNLKKFMLTLNNLSEEYGFPLIVSTHPRTRKRFDELKIELHPLVRLIKPLGFLDYVHLEMHAKVVLSDSGTITEESSILNFPALNIREVHERPEGMEEGAVMLVGFDKEKILAGISILSNQPRGANRSLMMVYDYKVTNVSEKVLRIICSYTDFVNRVVWKKV